MARVVELELTEEHLYADLDCGCRVEISCDQEIDWPVELPCLGAEHHRAAPQPHAGADAKAGG